MKHLSRIFLLLSGTLLLAYYLPVGWHMLTAKRIRTPFIQYSDTGHGFLFTRVDYNETTKTGSVRYTDTTGREYERDAFEQMLPLTYYFQLYKDGTMPKEIKGVQITSAAIQREMWSLRLRPDDLDTPSVPLYTVFEAASGRAKLEAPEDFMRIRDDGRIEFLNPKTNKILPEKSALYTEAFARAGFAFPVTLSGANPNPRKPYDEGIYLADAENRIYRLRQIKGVPELIRIADAAADPGAWRALRPKNIIVNETENQELRALIIDTTGQPWLAVDKNFTLIKLPAEAYTPDSATFTLRANLLNRLLLIQTQEKITAVALDRDYNVLDIHEELLPTAARQPATKISRVLFPFHWWLRDDSSGYFNFHGAPGIIHALLLNAALLIIYIIFIQLHRESSGTGCQPVDGPAAGSKSTGTLAPPLASFLAHIPQFAVIALAGICGLIAALLLPKAE